MSSTLAIIGVFTVAVGLAGLILVAARMLAWRLRRTWFGGKTCSRNVARIMARHEDRHVRVVQLGTRVSMLVDLDKASDEQCDCPRRLEVADWIKEGGPRS